MAMTQGWADLPDDLLDMVAKRTPATKGLRPPPGGVQIMAS